MNRMMYVILFLIIGISISAQTNDKNKIELNVNKISLLKNGLLIEDIWQNSHFISNFITYWPNEGKKPNNNTEVYFTRDEQNIYVGFICYDNDIKGMPITEGKRDDIPVTDDCIKIKIWPEGNSQTYYEFKINAKNIQADMLSGNIYVDYDWQSYTNISEDSWQGKLILPLKIFKLDQSKERNELRYQITRRRNRKIAEDAVAPPLTRSNPSDYEQAGRMIIVGKFEEDYKRYEITPYLTASQAGRRKNGVLNNDDVIGRVGIDKASYLFSHQSILSLAINPDFSTAELDAPRITVNQRFALSYPENRAFFFDGFDLFRTDYNSFYSRTINDPLLIAKYTSKSDNFSYGLISAYDQQSPFIMPFEDYSITINSSKKSLSNIFRAKYDFGDNYIGVITTNRDFSDGYNRVFGVDGQLRITTQNYVGFTYLKSFTKEIEDPTLVQDNTTFAGHTAIFDGEKYDGNAMNIYYSHGSQNFMAYASFENISSEFRADNSYIRQNNYRTLYANAGPLFQFDNDIIKSLMINFNGTKQWNTDGLRKYYDYGGAIAGTMIFQTSFSLGYREITELWDGIDFSRWSISSEISSNFSKYLNIVVVYNRNKEINYFATPAWLGYSDYITTKITIKPITSLSFRFSYSIYKLYDSESDDVVSKQEIWQFRTVFQPFKDFTFRSIISKDSNTKMLTLSNLVTYQLSAFTALYLGSNNIANTIPTIIENNHQYYLKVKYTF